MIVTYCNGDPITKADVERYRAMPPCWAPDNLHAVIPGHGCELPYRIDGKPWPNDEIKFITGNNWPHVAGQLEKLLKENSHA